MRGRNWPKYNKELVQRGSLTFLLDPKEVKKFFKKPKKQGPGRPQEYNNPLIEFLMTVKVHFKLAYRALEGFAKSFLSKLFPKQKTPNYTSICKRVLKLGVSLPELSKTSCPIVILDASGMKVCGEGEWKVKIHGRGRPRKWVKVHLAINSETLEIVAEITTESNVGDSKMTGPLLDQIPGRIKTVLADGAYDRQEAREAIKKRNAEPLIPPPKNARCKHIKDERDSAILIIAGLGGDRLARSLWGKLTGYNFRVLVESTFSSIKRLFGDRLFSKTFERQKVESRLRCVLVNKMRMMKV